MSSIHFNPTGSAWESRELPRDNYLVLRPGASELLTTSPSLPAADDPGWAGFFLPLGSTDGTRPGPHFVGRPGHAVRAGGQPLAGGLKRFTRRCEHLLVGGRSFFVVRDAEARLETFEGPEALPCPRCGDMIEPGHEVGVCGCKTILHETPERGCFSYGECPSCGASPVLNPEPWTPAEL